MPGEFYFQDNRGDLVPSEHLAVDGIDGHFAARLAEQPGWTREHVSLLEKALVLYVDRYETLAARFSFLSPPRLKTLAVISQPDSIRPFARILNESCSTLYLSDIDPAISNPEFAAFLLALAERREETGEVLLAPLHLAPWWFERTSAEVDAFSRAARNSPRPDAESYRAIGNASGWMKKLRHRTARPARRSKDFHEIAGTGLLVPHAQKDQPGKLLEQIRNSANQTLASFYARQHVEPGKGLHELTAYLQKNRPPLIITDANQAVLWDASEDNTAAVEARLAECGQPVLQSILEDLRCIASRTQTFLDSLVSPEALAPTDQAAEQSGYAFMHRSLGKIAYNLDEPAIERLRSPAIPYARAMLGARTLHEWAHRAVDSGWVPRQMDDPQWKESKQVLASLLDGVIAELPADVRTSVAADLKLLEREASAGATLTDLFENRIEDFSANLLAARIQTTVERESYVRQNVRPLRRLYSSEKKLRTLVRYLYEFQYLHFSSMADPQAYFFEATWFEADFFESGILDGEKFEELTQAAARLCRAHAVDETRFRFQT